MLTLFAVLLISLSSVTCHCFYLLFSLSRCALAHFLYYLVDVLRLFYSAWLWREYVAIVYSFNLLLKVFKFIALIMFWTLCYLKNLWQGIFKWLRIVVLNNSATSLLFVRWECRFGYFSLFEKRLIFVLRWLLRYWFWSWYLIIGNHTYLWLEWRCTLSLTFSWVCDSQVGLFGSCCKIRNI